MPNTPCWADMAAAEYANDPIEDYIDAICETADELDGWSVESIRTKLKPHELEALDGIINTVAERLLEERVRDSFVEPDWGR